LTDLRQSYYEELQNCNLVDVEYCSNEENDKLSGMQEDGIPNNVQKSIGTKYYHRYVSDLSDEEKKLFLMTKQLSNLKSIKNCLIFFVVLAIIGLIIGFIGVFVH
jgi:hypothetical protein